MEDDVENEIYSIIFEFKKELENGPEDEEMIK